MSNIRKERDFYFMLLCEFLEPNEILRRYIQYLEMKKPALRWLLFM